MKDILIEFLHKCNWEGDMLYVLKNWPELAKNIGLEKEAKAFIAAEEAFENKLDELIERYGVNTDEIEY